MQDQTARSNPNTKTGDGAHKAVSVPSDVKQYEAPIKRMENEAGYREWLDRGKLVVPPGEMNEAQHHEHRARAEQDASITHEINGMLQLSKVNMTDLNVSVSDCDVTVMGCVPDRATMEQIVAVCERAKGVGAVINNLKIYDPDHDAPGECITAKTKIETHTHSELDPNPSDAEPSKLGQGGFAATTTKLLSAALGALHR